MGEGQFILSKTNLDFSSLDSPSPIFPECEFYKKNIWSLLASKMLKYRLKFSIYLSQVKLLKKYIKYSGALHLRDFSLIGNSFPGLFMTLTCIR